ncbi:MAG: V-type ATP synthase subunit E [Verrucomicrobiota bacterium]|jgi:vacuolar-type H+-ATPase subunit E/Vma4
MATSDSNASAILIQAVRDDARRQADEILARANHEAVAILAQATAEASQTRQEQLQVAQAEAQRRTDAIQATISVEAGRLRATQVEALLQSLYADVRSRLVSRQGYDYREMLVALVTEVARQIGDTGLVVKLSPPDRAAVAERLKQFTLVDDPSMVDGGVVVLDAAGRRLWDNRLPSRLDRLWPELRRQIVAHIGGGT